MDGKTYEIASEASQNGLYCVFVDGVMKYEGLTLEEAMKAIEGLKRCDDCDVDL